MDQLVIVPAVAMPIMLESKVHLTPSLPAEPGLAYLQEGGSPPSSVMVGPNNTKARQGGVEVPASRPGVKMTR
jgi:hypothetical protein